MLYSIKEAASKTGLSEHTLRYYDKEQMLPYLERTPSGIRRFSDRDIEWISFLNCLKNTGMSIQQIKHYTELCKKGDETLRQRLAIFIEQRETVLAQLCELEHNLEVVDYKIQFYKEECVAYEKRVQEIQESAQVK